MYILWWQRRDVNIHCSSFQCHMIHINHSDLVHHMSYYNVETSCAAYYFSVKCDVFFKIFAWGCNSRVLGPCSLSVASSSTFPAFPVGEQKCSKQLSQWESDNSVSRSQKCWKTCTDSQGEFPNTKHKIQSQKRVKLMKHLRSCSATEFTECISNLDTFF